MITPYIHEELKSISNLGVDELKITSGFSLVSQEHEYETARTQANGNPSFLFNHMGAK